MPDDISLSTSQEHPDVLQKVSLPDGNFVMVEARCLDPEQKVGYKLPSFTEIAGTITSITTVLASAINKAKPHTASIEFGVEIAVESGQLTALIVKGGAKANLKITLTWEAGKDATKDADKLPTDP
jgi:hypothetical protein